jgi:sulfonate transport system ATP-binding protein
MAAVTAVHVSSVRKAFDGRTVLDGVSLDIERGEFLALLGASGAGKTTLLRILGGLDTASSGTVLVPESRTIVFQEPRLVPSKRVLANVIVGLPRSDAARGEQALGEVGLAGRARDWPHTLSGGEAQRVALARALVRSPDLLLLDEPFAALDALTRLRMQDMVASLVDIHQPAVLLVTHDVDEAIRLADRVAVLRGGRLITDEPVTAPRPRDSADPAFTKLRRRLLTDLGVKLPQEVAS